MNKNVLTLLFLSVISISLLSMASAVTLDIGTNLTNGTISLYVDSVPVIVTQAVVGDNDINLTNPSWSNGELSVSKTGVLSFNSGYTQTSTFPRFSSASAESKTFATGIGTVVADYTFNVNTCESIGNIVQKSSSGATKASFQKGGYTCSNNQVSLVLSVANGDTLSITYGCSSMANTGFQLIMLFSGLGIIAFVIFFVYRKGLGNMSLGDIVIVAIGVITSVIFWSVAGQTLGGACPVS